MEYLLNLCASRLVIWLNSKNPELLFECLKFRVPIYPVCSGEVKELRDFFKKTSFIKAFEINQARKHSQQKVKNSDRFVRLDLPKQIARQTPCSGTVYYFVFGFILLIVLLIIIVLSKITIMIKIMK